MTDYKKKYKELAKELEKRYPDMPICFYYDLEDEPVVLMLHGEGTDFDIELYLEDLEDEFNYEIDDEDEDCCELMIYGYDKKKILELIEEILEKH